MDKPSWHQPAVVAKHPTIPRLSCQLKDGFRSVMPVVNLMFQEPIKIDTESFKPPHNPLPENHLQKQTQQQPWAWRLEVLERSCGADWTPSGRCNPTRKALSENHGRNAMKYLHYTKQLQSVQSKLTFSISFDIFLQSFGKRLLPTTALGCSFYTAPQELHLKHRHVGELILGFGQLLLVRRQLRPCP